MNSSMKTTRVPRIRKWRACTSVAICCLVPLLSIAQDQSFAKPTRGVSVASPNRVTSSQLVSPTRPSVASPSTPGVALVDARGVIIGRPFATATLVTVLTQINSEPVGLVGLTTECSPDAPATCTGAPGAAVWGRADDNDVNGSIYLYYEAPDCSGTPLALLDGIPGVPKIGFPVVENDGTYMYIVRNSTVIKKVHSMFERGPYGGCSSFTPMDYIFREIETVYRATDIGLPPMFFK